MARRDLTFRVFVSSTFSDLVAERNALQEHVFPRLRELCRKHGAQFQAIDLRWGVSEEASLDQQTMNICLAELHRCQRTTPRPNFIVLLGQRYGWCPLPPQIDATEFESLLAVLPDAKQQRLKQWYRRDDNAVPAEYCLQARADRFKDRTTWATEERELRALLREAIVRVGWAADDARRLKYEASATHQEILHGALQVKDTIDHVFGFFRTVEGLPQDATAGDIFDLDPQGRPDAETRERLDRLQAEMRTRLPNNIHTYSATWTGNGPSTDHLGTLPTDLEACNAMLAKGYEPRNLCEAVWCRLGRVMLEEVQRRDRSDPVDQEAIAHSAFGQDRARHFIGREDALARIREYVQADDRHPLVLHGVSGVGKSALMAKAAADHASRFTQHEVVVRYIGATPASSDLRALLEGLCKEITLRYGGDAASVPMEVRKLEQDFPQRLTLATADKPLAVFLDALDQLSSTDDARNLWWLPREMPAHVKLVVSVLEKRGNEAKLETTVGDCLAVLRGRLAAESFVQIGPLTADCGAQLLEAWLAEARRTLQPQQRQEVLEKSAVNGLPLYLKLAFEEARRWKSWGPFGVPPSGGPDRVSAELQTPDSRPLLSPDVDGLIERLFNRLSEPANHGPLLVERAIGYLRCSRHGLSEDEMLDLLANDADYWEHFRQAAHHALPETDGQQARRLPVVVWSRLYHDLESYMSWRSGDGTALMAFFHARFNEVADRQFLRDDTVSRARHERLADYFLELADPARNQSWKGENPRPFLELPFHLARYDAEELAKILFTFNWLQAKTNKGLVLDLIQDYDEAMRSFPTSHSQRHSLELVQSSLELSTHALSSDTYQLASQLIGRLSNEIRPEIPPLVASASAWRGAPWLRPLNGNLQRPGTALRRTLQGHTEGVEAVALSADGRRAVSGSNDKTLKVWDMENGRTLRTLRGHNGLVRAVALTADGQRAVSGSEDKTLKLWDVESGQEIRTLKGHSGFVVAVALSADGRRAVSGSYDKTLKVWDVENGRELRTLRGHAHWVKAVALSADGQWAVSGSWDRTLKVWDMENGRELQTLRGHADNVDAVAMSADGRLVVSGSWDRTVKVWDVGSGREIRALQGHAGLVYAVTLSADRRSAVSGSSDHTLKVWDLESGLELRTLQGHADAVRAVTMSAIGRWAVSASDDHTLKIWDLEGRMGFQTFQGHTEGIEAVSLSADGRRAVSASRDKTLKVWDVESGREVRSLQGHTNMVNAVAMTADGRRAVSGSSDCSLKVWDLDSGRELATLKGYPGDVRGVALSADGQRAVSGSLHGTVIVWNMLNRRELRTLREHGRSDHAVTLSADGLRAVSGRENHTLDVWDVATGRKLRTLKGHASFVNGVALSADGRLLLSGSSDQTLKVWDVESEQELRTLIGHGNWVLAVVLSADGRWAASGSWDQTLKVWGLESGKCLATFTGDSHVLCCGLASDGRTIVAGEQSGRIHFLRLVLPDDPVN